MESLYLNHSEFMSKCKYETAKQNQKFPFHCGGGVGGGDARKMQGNFLVFAHASPRACPRRIVSLHHAIGAYGEV